MPCLLDFGHGRPSVVVTRWDTMGHLADQATNIVTDTRDTRGQFWPPQWDICTTTLQFKYLYLYIHSGYTETSLQLCQVHANNVQNNL